MVLFFFRRVLFAQSANNTLRKKKSVLGKHMLDMWCDAARLRRAASHQDSSRGRLRRPRAPTVYLLTTEREEIRALRTS